MYKKSMRIITIFITSAIIIRFVVGCYSLPNNIPSVGEWIQLLADSFGMTTYTSELPHISSVDTDNPYFPAVQSAYEWESLPSNKLNTNDKLTKGFVASTLVRTVGLYDVSSCNEEEIINFAVANDYVKFTYGNRTDAARYISSDEALASIEASLVIFSNRRYNSREEIIYADDVVLINESAVLSPVFNIHNNIITISEDYIKELSEGDIFLLPPVNVNDTGNLYVADNVEVANGVAYITINEVSLYDDQLPIEKMHVSGTTNVNFSNTPIIDGVGNITYPSGNNNMRHTSSSIQGVVHSGGQSLTPLAGAKISFKVDDFEIEGSISENSAEFKLSGEIKNVKGLSISLNKSFEIKDITLAHKIDIDFFKLESADINVCYTTVDKTGVGVKSKGEVKAYYDNRKSLTLANILDAEMISTVKDPKKSIKICSIPIVTGGLLAVNLDIKAKISLSGDVDIVLTTTNSYGVQYKNGKTRFIRNTHRDEDVTVKGKVEGTMYIGVSMRAVNINIIGFGVECGIGVEGKTTLLLTNINENKLLDLTIIDGNLNIVYESAFSYNSSSLNSNEDDERTKIDCCFDLSVYFIIRCVLDDESAVVKLCKVVKEITLELELLGKDNATFIHLHLEDNFDNVGKCTRSYSGETNNGESSQSPNTDEPTTISESIDIDTYYQNLYVGESSKLTITRIPNGYTINDVIIEPLNPMDISIVQVNADGTIKAIAPGDVVIVARTHDNEYRIECIIEVNSVMSSDYVPFGI